jgi:DNA-binding MarR family transcriptional regulator
MLILFTRVPARNKCDGFIVIAYINGFDSILLIITRRMLLVNIVSIRYYIQMNTLMTQQLLQRLASLLRSESRRSLLEYALQPVQFDALYYLSICNRYSDTPMSVTEYLGQTKGSVSQTLKVLEKKGLIVKVTDSIDKRVSHMAVTEEGRKLVNEILPSPLLQVASDLLGDKDIAGMNSSLSTLLRTVQQANNFKSFGQCFSCCHHIKSGVDNYFCGLTKEPLTKVETRLICREHEPNKSNKSGALKYSSS